MLVEDNSVDTMLVIRTLQEVFNQSELIVATDGEEALRMLRRESTYAGLPRPDLVMVDINLPSIDGLEVLKTIKGDDDLRMLPVFIFSGTDAADDVTRSYREYATAYMVKPGSADEYRDLFNRFKDYWFDPHVVL